jgi:hypothetical protein
VKNPILGKDFNSWIMTPLKEEGEHFILELLYNQKYKKGHSIVFSILKRTFYELFTKI